MANILLVDDSRTSRRMLRNILESAGHTIIDEATDGEQAICQHCGSAKLWRLWRCSRLQTVSKRKPDNLS